ncbi:hypothetical protein ACS0TY_025185 [Phlomoides rotata]
MILVKTIQTVLLEGTGGKARFTIETVSKNLHIFRLSVSSVRLPFQQQQCTKIVSRKLQSFWWQ